MVMMMIIAVVKTNISMHIVTTMSKNNDDGDVVRGLWQ